jgi:hypothetical protein
VDLPTGMNVNLEPRPKCRLSALVLHGVNGCSRQSRIGAGTAVLDGRAAGRGYPLRARVRVFSALWDVPPPPPGFPSPHVFVAYASAPDAGLFIGMGNNPRFDRSALGVYGGGILGMPVGMAVEELNLTFRSMRWPRAEGAKPLIQAPTRCTSSWRFTAAYQFVRFGPRLTATDDVPCREKR